ncbi:flagellin [Massilia cavernae]|uniref:Flagellin N-terminal domain-containing protein n=1 Tax=Massilia cavernae TaxID=2320864 RepID=A0A418Y8F0_9BURK|nr:hypothetical protein [Massilia cavernae]RJG27477.1 hypothetical protein D3872_01095 [Massilia cavernae]
MARTINRLSSGLRIQSASDDAAGMAMAERMSAGLRGNAEANRNINEAASTWRTSRRPTSRTAAPRRCTATASSRTRWRMPSCRARPASSSRSGSPKAQPN